MLNCQPMAVQPIRSDPIEAFLDRWDGTEQAERANYVAFLNELCAIIDVRLPDAARGSGGNYRYERSVTHHAVEGVVTTRRIDLYRRDRFILEAEQGANPFGRHPYSARPKPNAALTFADPDSGHKLWSPRRAKQRARSVTSRPMKQARSS